MHDKIGFVAEVTEGFGQKAEVAVPEELVRADGEVGVEKDFQSAFFQARILLWNLPLGQVHPGGGGERTVILRIGYWAKRECECGGRADGLLRPIERFRLEWLSDPIG